MDRKRVGALAEQIAVEYLQSKGHRIMGRNYQKPWGEIDIISHYQATIIFTEVKANLKQIEGFEPELRANATKMHKVARTAQLYLQDHFPNQEREWQLDIISITFNPSARTAKIKHFKNVAL